MHAVFRRFLALTLLLAGLVSAPAWALFSLSGFQNSMIEFLIDQLSTEGELEITVERIDDQDDGATAIQGLAIADADGVWLRADALEFSWNPSRLLRGEVEFANLAIRGVSVLRPPVVPSGDLEEVDAEPQDQDAPLIPEIAWPRSPLSLRVDQLELTDVDIAEGVIGHGIVFDAKGSLRDEGDVQAANLTITRTDDVLGEIALAYERTFSTGTLALDLTAEEAPDGIIAALSGLPSEAESSLSLKAAGPPTDWRLALDLALAETIAVTGTANVAYQGPLAMDAVFEAKPGRLLDPQIATLLGTQAELVAKITEGVDTKIEIADFRVTSPDLNLTASGSFVRSSSEADLALSLDAGARLADPFEGVNFGGLTFDGKVVGAPGDITAEGDLTLEGLVTAFVDVASAALVVDVRQSTPDPEPAANGQTPPTPDATTELDISGTTRGLRLDQLTPEVIGDAELILSASLTGPDLTLSRVFLGSDPLDIAASGRANVETTDLALNVAVSAPDLAPVAGAYGLEATGGVAMTGQVRRASEVTDADVDLRLTQFSHPMAEARRLRITGNVVQDDAGIAFRTDGDARRLRIDRIGPDLLPNAQFMAEGNFADDVLDLMRSSLSSPLLSITAAGTLDTRKQMGEIAYTVTTPDLGPVARLYGQQAGGALSAKGVAALAGGDTAPNVAGTLSVLGLRFDDANYGRIDLGHDVNVSEAPSGRLTLRSEGSPYGSARAATNFAMSQPQLSLTDLDVTVLGVAASGALDVDLDGPLVAGGLAISSGDLRTLRPLTGQALGGAAQGRVRLTTTAGQQNADLTLSVSGLDTGDAKVASTQITAALADVLGTPAIRAELVSSGIEAAPLSAGEVTVTARGPLSRLDVASTARGQVGDKPLTFDTALRANLAGQTTTAQVSRLEISLAEDQVALNRPLDVRSQGGTTALRGIDLSLPSRGRLAGDVIYRGGPIAADLTLDAPNLGYLNRLAGLPITQGGLNAEVRVDSGRSTGDITLAARKLRLADVATDGTLDISSEISWRGRAADIVAQVIGDFGQPLDITASVPIARRGGLPILAARGPVSAAVTWQGEVEKLWSIVPASGHFLSGQTNVDLGVSGDISSPVITGGVKVSEGGYQNVDAGTILTDLALATTLDANGGLSFDLNARDGASGTVSTTGRVSLDASGLDIKTRFDNAVLVRRDDVLARLRGGIDVSGPMDDLLVAGKVTIDEAEVRLVNNNPPNIVTLEKVLIKGEAEPEDDAADSRIRLEIDVDAPGRLFVRGRGLDSEWGLDLAIRGRASSPRITGRIERLRGALDLLGTTFDLTRGRIDFDGGREIDPRVDVILEHDRGDLVGRIVVDGPASDPKLQFTSSPSLPEDEVLPRTLFGKSSQALTPSQGIQLALGLATLMDGGGGTLDAVRGAVGLDQLRIEQDDEGNPAVGLGKEVADGVWVGSRQSLGGGQSSVAVEIEVFEGIELDAEIEAGGNSSVGVQWKRDF